MDILVKRIIDLRESKDWSQAELARRLGLDKSVMNKIENGTRKISSEELRRLSAILDVSSDYLLGRDEKPYYELTNKEKKDIGIEAERMLEGLYTDAELDFYGEPMTDEDKERMKTILEMGLQLNKEKAKKKFTNKKYRNDSK